MRVISGIYKGRKLTAPAGNDVRPTSDMVKEAVFSMLSDRLLRASCLDLFAGTGSLGIEALSRGASSCVFCEISPAAIAAITENLRFVSDGTDGEFVEGTGKKKTRIIKSDFRAALRMIGRSSQSGHMDIVFIDPPYKANYYAEVMKTMLDYDIIIDRGIAVLERGMGDAPAYDGFELIRHKRYGKTVVDIYERVTHENS